MSYVNKSTFLINSNSPKGIELANNNVTTGGINVGFYAPEAVGLELLNANVDEVWGFERCGEHALIPVGVVRGEGGNEVFNEATIRIFVEC